MLTRFIILFLAIGSLFSCQAIMRYHFGIKNPEIEKEKTVTNLMEKNKIANSHLLKKDKIYDAYIGSFPKVFIFDKNGYQVVMHNCYEMIEDNLRALADTIPEKLSPHPLRDSFVHETIQSEEDKFLPTGIYDYEVFFYWSVWLGKFNINKMRLAQKTINAINQGPSQKKLVLIPVNFDFIKESGWTEESVEEEMKRIADVSKKK